MSWRSGEKWVGQVNRRSGLEKRVGEVDQGEVSHEKWVGEVGSRGRREGRLGRVWRRSGSREMGWKWIGGGLKGSELTGQLNSLLDLHTPASFSASKCCPPL